MEKASSKVDANASALFSRAVQLSIAAARDRGPITAEDVLPLRHRWHQGLRLILPAVLEALTKLSVLEEVRTRRGDDVVTRYVLAAPPAKRRE